MSKKEKPLSKAQLDRISRVFAKARNNYSKDISYRKFAEYMGISHSTIQAIENARQEPSISVINAYREKFGGTYAYWLGESTCKELQNEEVHKMIGLSDKAINKLKEYNQYIKKNEAGMDNNYFNVAQRIQALNYIIENIEHNGFNPDEDMNTTEKNLLDNIYTFLFCDFDTKIRPNGYAYDRKIKINGEDFAHSEFLQKSEVRTIYLLNIQKNLNKMRDEIQQKELEILMDNKNKTI